jgi:hypothetical protein
MASTINASTSSGLVNTADTSGVLQLQTANTAAVTIDASQNVGIGTASPVTKLNVVQSTAADVLIRLSNTNAGVYASTLNIDAANATGSRYNSLYSSNGGTYQWSISGGGADSTMAFGTGSSNTERMRISSGGNVGIGTTSPSYKLQVTSTTANQEVIFTQTANSNTSTGLGGEGPFAMQNTNTTAGNMAAISNFDGNGNINSQINFVNVDHSGSSAIAFTTRTGGSYGERMRIDSSGRLLVGTISVGYISGYQMTVAHSGTGGAAFKYDGTSETNAISLQNGNGQVGRIYTSGTNTTYATSSDYRLKENIVPMTGALAKVQSLNPVTYKWKSDGTDGQGFIAHELAEVVPDCVGGKKDAVDADGNPVYQDIDTSFLVATLTAAIQEQQALITDLTTRLAALEGAK